MWVCVFTVFISQLLLTIKMSLSVCLELTNQSTVEQVVDKQETIQSLKLRIAADCKVHPEYIHLLWNGEVLDDKKSFSAYDIKEKDTVIVKGNVHVVGA